MTELLRAAAVATLLLLSFAWAQAGPQDFLPNFQHMQYYAGTPNELNIYRVYGARPGKTLMIIGGIQGDETGAFLSADMYADLALLQGNLIVVPRANLYSIILNNRGPDGDMNRQFGDYVTAARHKQIVDVLKELMAESDALLNLHEGSGFYRPTWISDQANPNRYGQCIIADTDKYVKPDGSVLNLEAMANAVLNKVNPQIENAEHRMLFNNHRTSNMDSMHKEQRLSATYYALTQCNIPAFGIECSKSITNLNLKVQYQHLVINAFMDYLDIKPQTPSLRLPTPEFHYLLVRVNHDKELRVVGKGGELRLNPGDTVSVEHIEGNYNRGFYCSILGVGTINDLGKSYIISKPTQILVRKDNTQLGEVKITINTSSPVPPAAVPAAPLSDAPRLVMPAQRGKPYLLLEREGRQCFLAHNETLHVVRGDKITLVDMLGLNLPNSDKLEINFKGFAPASAPNSGDDRGYVIDTDKDLMPRYGRPTPDGNLYQVVILQNKRELAQMNIIVSPPAWEYLLYRRNDGQAEVCYPGQEVKFNPGESLKILDVKSNIISGLDYVLLLPDGKRIALTGNTINTNNSAVRQACQSGQKLRLAWLRSGRGGQIVGQITLSQKED